MVNWPNVDLIKGAYSIPAHQTATFTFWWPDKNDQEDDSITEGYFDVSIRVTTGISTPLLEVKREYNRESDYIRETEHAIWRTLLLLTLQNDNDVDVEFWAAHLLVHH